MTLKEQCAIAVLAVAAALCLAASPASANERRCAELGSDCVCSEPLNTNTYGGGRAFPRAGDPCFASNCNLDFDDSPDAKECRWGGEWTAIQGGGNVVAVTAASEPLPPGHLLTWVFERATPGHRTDIWTPPVNEPLNTTYCVRSYQRWSPDSVPTSYTPCGDPPMNSQYKLQTIGGRDPEGNHNPMQLQIKADSAVVETRADGNWFNFPPDQQILGHMSDCVNNYCRFEICLDLPPNGIANARFRQVKLAPGTPQTWTVTKQPARTQRSSITFSQGTAAVGFFSQCLPSPGTQNRFATHAITARHSPADTNWWIGAACEVEGGCNGAPPPVLPPVPVAPALSP